MARARIQAGSAHRGRFRMKKLGKGLSTLKKRFKKVLKGRRR